MYVSKGADRMKRYIECPNCGNEISIELVEHNEQIRAEVIEEFVKAIEKHQTRQDSYLDPPYVEIGLDMTDVLEVAEQLKEHNEQNSIIEALKPRGCADMPKEEQRMLILVGNIKDNCYEIAKKCVEDYKNEIYNQALEDCRKMCGVDTPHYTNCIGCPLAHFENDFDTTICKLVQLKK